MTVHSGVGEATPQSPEDWLAAGAPGAAQPDAVLLGLCERLLAAGVAVERVSVLVSTLHPNVHGRRILWEKGQGVRISEAPLGTPSDAIYLNSPVNQVIESRAAFRQHLEHRPGDDAFPLLHELHGEGFTDYLALPLPFTDGKCHVAGFATRRPGGFSAAEIAALERVAVPLARLAEIYALKRIAGNILDAYVGRRAGQQVLAGSIHRGDLQVIRCAVFFSDIADYSTLYAAATPREIIDLLNRYFDTVCSDILARGGEVLKFIGDSVLAIFPSDTEAYANPCDAALAAALATTDALAKATDGSSPALRHRVGIDFGEVVFGNVGAVERLDFTVIGAPVNRAARLCNIKDAALGPVRLSAEAAAESGESLTDRGRFDLKGFVEPEHIFVPG